MVDFGMVITAMVSPFKNDGSMDYRTAGELAVHLAENGSDGIVAHGTTGESPTLTHEEEYELYRTVKKALKGKAKLIAGTGSNSTETSIKSTKVAEGIGVDGIMIVVPYYNKPSQEGMYQHFKAVASETKLPIIIYNIPGRTGVNMLPETVARLAQIRNIVGIKEASGMLDQVAEIRKRTPKEFVIYSGDDDKTYAIMERGGYGIISVASHIAGKEIKQMCELFHQGKKDEAKKINDRLSPLFKVLFITTNPAPVKAALEIVGRPVGGLRLPLVPVTAEEKEKIRRTLKDLNYI